MENTSTMSGAEIRTEIERANEKFMEAYRRADAKGMADLYTREGMVLPPNSESVQGHEQVQNFWKSVMDMGIKAIRLESQELELCNDTAIEMGQALLYAEGDMEVDRSKYIVIWKRENGAWKLHRDIFNSNQQQP